MENKAFTLIELLVVVLIIGVLTAVAVPKYQKAVEKTRLTEALILGNNIRDLEKIYYLANGEYTTNWEDLGMEAPAYKDYRSIQLEKGANNRVLYYYLTNPKDHSDIALFFWFATQKISCHAYTTYGEELCKMLNL